MATLAGLLALSSLSGGTEPPTMASLDWLSGCWQPVGGEPGSGEFWTPLAGESLLGISRTVRGGKTVAHEFLQIRPAADGGIALIALPSGQVETLFPLVSIAPRTAVFENPDHDFPQRVGYRFDGENRLDAWIEGSINGALRRIDFPMNRADCRASGFRPAESELLSLAEAWIERYNEGDAAAVADLYTADGHYASAHVFAHGRAAIQSYWAQGIAAGGHVDYVRPAEIRVDNELGYLLGSYQATNAGVTVDGRILIVGKRVDGVWRIAAHQTVVRDQPDTAVEGNR